METAIEWLKKEFYARGPIGHEMPNWLQELFEQAKAMEKEQQFRFFIAGQLSMEEGGKDFLQYYNKNYGKKMPNL